MDTDHYNYIVFPNIIKDLVNHVNQADISCFGKNERHYADYNFVHERTKYTVLHWLAYHNDSVSLLFILRRMWQPDSSSKEVPMKTSVMSKSVNNWMDKAKSVVGVNLTKNDKM